MGGLFGVVSKSDCVIDLFFGIDYHSHLGTKRGGMATYTGNGFARSIHNIENSPFRTKFERDVTELSGNMGIGCISDTEPQPMIVRSALGSYAITTVGRINNSEELINEVLTDNSSQFMEMSNSRINQTELVAALINKCGSIVEGIKYAGEKIDGSMTILVMTAEGIYAARDRLGRTPLAIGHKDGAYCIALEPFAYINLGYDDLRELGPGEIAFITAEGAETVQPPGEKMKICAFMWAYYGYPTSSYEGVGVEKMRYRCGAKLAQDDNVTADIVAGVPDSGTAHAIGYANKSGIKFARPFIKYTPTWPRSFMPGDKKTRNMVAKMKLVPVKSLIKDKNLILIDDSIVRGTQLKETADFLYTRGAKDVHIRPSCPPIMFGCKYLNFSRSTSVMDLITRQVIQSIEGKADDETVKPYTNSRSDKYAEMVEEMRRIQNFTSLKFQTLENMLDSIGVDKDKLCTYCWNGEE